MVKYNVYVTPNDYLEIEAAYYDGGGKDTPLVFHSEDDDVVAKFKMWVAVIVDNG